MGTTTFSGPIKAGTIQNTTGTTVGDDVANVGYVVMAQSVAWQQTTTTDTGMVIPANSQIVEIELLITTAPTSANLTIGNASGGAQLGTSLALGTTDDKVLKFSAADTTDLWANVGSSDVPVWVTSSAGTAGRGVLTVSYIQGNDLTLIA
jgi:hypothetical protein